MKDLCDRQNWGGRYNGLKRLASAWEIAMGSEDGSGSRKTYTLQREQLVPRERDEVFAFFADPANLAKITPGSLGFKILTPMPIEMRAGAQIDYRLKVFGWPFYWQTQITEFEAPERFVDVQSRGPYRRWEHTHRFLQRPNGTLVVDEVHYELPWGLAGRLAQGMVRRQLDQIFDYRRRQIASRFGGT